MKGEILFEVWTSIKTICHSNAHTWDYHVYHPETLRDLAIASLLGLVAVRAVYLVFFHPLSTFPGPWMAKFTNAYAAYHSLKGDMHLELKKLHSRHGKTVRYAPNRLAVNTPKALEDIYGFGKPIRKSKSYLPMVPWKDGWTVLSCINKSLHRKMRRTLMDGMSDTTLREFEPIVLAQLDLLIQMLTKSESTSSKWSEAFDMSQWGKFLSIDSMAQLGFGQKIGLLEDPKTRFIVNAFDLYTMRTGFNEQWPELWQLGLERLLNFSLKLMPGGSDFRRWREGFTDKAIDENGRAKRGIFSQLVRGTDQNSKAYRYTNPQMLAEGSFTLLVGGDSNASALSASLFYLSRFPQAQATLRDEIRTHFPDPSTLSALSPSPLPDLHYLRAFTMEVLRLCPPTPGVPWRETEESGAIVDDQFLPPGTDVGTCMWLIHRDPKIFRHPDLFWPERWLPGMLPVAELKAAQAVCKPFSLGPRACAGKKVALMVLHLALAKILLHCEFKVPEGSLGKIGEREITGAEGAACGPDFQVHTHFTAVTQGPFLQFKKQNKEHDH